MFPRRISASEAKQNLREKLFHGMKKTITVGVRHKHDSVNYLTLLVAARKAKDESFFQVVSSS